ncbi:MAG: hypothetical protein M0Z55_12425 [Peptococcaceae bacterium]|nr:hypothetical protein [Peptococcaceae bacterium]
MYGYAVYGASAGFGGAFGVGAIAIGTLILIALGVVFLFAC